MIYYDIRKDIESYPDADVFIIWSRRGPGKTYSTLRMAYEDGLKIIYLKRTKHDVEFITNMGPNGEDQSPYAPLNRDFGWKIQPVQTKDYSSFYNIDEEGNPYGEPVSIVFALSQIKDVKGFELSDCDWLVFDEFIPQPGEIIRKAEGAMLLSIYETISRDRVERGKEPLKLILLANAEEISTPITREMELIDEIVEVTGMKQPRHIRYNEERGCVMHHLSQEEFPIDEKRNSRGMARFMAGTSWYDKAYGGQFTSNDFSCVGNKSLKHAKPYIELLYKRHKIYIYMYDDGSMFVTDSPSKHSIFSFNLNRENELRKFYLDRYFDILERYTNDMVIFKKYSYLDLIINIKQYFDL